MKMNSSPHLGVCGSGRKLPPKRLTELMVDCHIDALPRCGLCKRWCEPVNRATNDTVGSQNAGIGASSAKPDVRSCFEKGETAFKMPALRCRNGRDFVFLCACECGFIGITSPVMLDESTRSVDPKGLGLILLGVSIFFLIPTAIVIILRCYIRLKHRVFGIDDGLMLFGWLLHVAFTGIGIKTIYTGLGMKDEDLNAFLQVDGRKWFWIGQILYCLSLIPLKCSICVTLLRIAVTKLHRIIVWATIVFTVVTMLYNFIGGFVGCIPVTANWDNRGKCSVPFLMSTAYVVSIGAVVSDWVCAILPIFMLYKANMRKATKVSVSIILGLAALASLCTIIRLPYLKAFSHPHDYLYNVAYIVLWSTLESGIGIVAGSLPSLRKLVSSRFHFDTSTRSSPAHITPFSGNSRAVITSQSVSAVRRTHRTDLGDNWEQLDDIEGLSSKKIYVKVDLEMQSLERPETSRESQGSREDLVHP